MIKKLFLLFSFSILFVSCIQMRGIGDDYRHLADKEKGMILPYKEATTFTRQNVYKVNAEDLKQALQNYPKAFVYVFTQGCSSEFFLPLSIYEGYAKKNGYKVFFVMSSYKDLDLALLEPISEPLYVIDSDFYRNKFFRRYVQHFENELKGKDKKAKVETYETIHFFENGEYINSLNVLPK